MPLLFAHDQTHMKCLSTNFIDHESGAHVCFFGTVRSINHKKAVSYLSYEAYPELAVLQFLAIEEQAKKKFAIRSINAVHRVGQVMVGEPAVRIDVRAQHREPAFLAARFVMDELKKSVPIWKCEYYEDGTKSWDQGLCHCSLKEHASLGPVKKALQRQEIDPSIIASKKVLLIGAGGLGCPLALNLSALGIATLGIVDGDIVSETNLARQFCYRRSEIGLKKSFLLAEFVRERFSTEVREHDCMIDAASVAMIKDYDLVVDATDSMATKVMLAHHARLMGVPFISSSVYQAEGEVMLLLPQSREGCFSCFRKNPSVETCADTGVLTHACFMIAAHASALALSTLSGAQKNRFCLVQPSGIMELRLTKDPKCLMCSPLRIKRSEESYDQLQ